MFLAQALNDDRSCSKAVNDLIIQKNHKKITKKSQKDPRPISPNMQAYCLAWQKLPFLKILRLNGNGLARVFD
jgi:hypothetical protein